MTDHQLRRYITALASALTIGAGLSFAQQATNQASAAGQPQTDEETITLSPFEVSAEATNGYAVATSLAGNRLNTELKDVGSAISVVNEQFMKDIGATDNASLLAYTTATEVGTAKGNFAGTGYGATQNEAGLFVNPNSNTRVRGLSAADNTRDFFASEIPWEGYNIDRVDLQRGPNSILFGLGSPAGIVNNSTKGASFKRGGSAEVRFDRWGSVRTVLNDNEVLLKGELAIRVAAVNNKEQYQQQPAYANDKRAYVAARYEPKFLRINGAHTTLKANFEIGNVQSNRPRMLPPGDFITQWFTDLNRATYDPFNLQDNNTKIAGNGAIRPTYADGTTNPYYKYQLGNFGQYFGGVLASFNSDASDAISYRSEEIRTVNGISKTGAVDGAIDGLPYERMTAIDNYYMQAKNANMPFSQYGLYKNRSLTDASIFDFYNKLLDGPNKHEWQKFQAYNLSAGQTFFNNQLGFELVYDKQSYKNGQTSLMTDWRQGLFIDMMATRSDGTANPNVGRPFIQDSWQYQNGTYRSDRDAIRFTGYYTLDFTRFGKGWATKLAGKHTFTGLASRDSVSKDSRSFQHYAVDDASYKSLMFAANSINSTKFSANELAVNAVVYLGPSLLTKSSAAGANIPNATAIATPKTANVTVYDSTWKGAGIDPAASWNNTRWPADNTSYASTQSENPANYVGWKTQSVNIVDALSSQAMQDYLSTGARLTKDQVSSKAFVWQGQFWGKALIPMFGYRKDRALSWSYQPTVNANTGHVVVDPSSYKLAATPNNIMETNSRSWSFVTHLNEYVLPKNFPVNISLYYNQSSNFQPAANRVDVYNNPLSAPTGKTRDTGIMISTKDEKYSIKINKFETSQKDASSSSLSNWWFVGGLEAWGADWANIYQYHLGGTTMDTANTGSSGRYTYSPAPGEDQAAADARQAAAIAGWRAHQANMAKTPYYTAWKLDYAAVVSHSYQQPSGTTLTEDQVSKGYELELNATPVSNLRLSLNVAKIEAVRNNIGGTAFAELVGIINKDLNANAQADGSTRGAGDLRIWWGAPGSPTTLTLWNQQVGSDWAMKKLQEGTDASELRKYRVNLVANYDFKTGFMKGVNTGVGYRWQSDVVIGYKPVAGKTPQDISFDLANPYKGPAETAIDLWVGYGHRLTKKLDWRVQLNVRDVGKKNRLIPISTQPDGTPAAYRIGAPMSWSITNTVSF